MRRLLPVVPLVLVALGAPAAAADRSGASSPHLDVRATPRSAFPPALVLVTGQLVGGDDLEEFYCPTLEWDWGDDTRSEATQDCEPYEAGRSEIRRRFTAEHTFQHGGNFKVMFRIKRKDKIITAVSSNIQVRPGPSEGF